MIWSISWAFLVCFIYLLTHWDWMSISFILIGVIGSALAIFVAFRNQSSYSRWWEARTLWQGIVTHTRILARLVITFTDSHKNQPQYDHSRSEEFKRHMVYACIAWAHALRMHLREQDQYFKLKPFFSDQAFSGLLSSHHKPNYLHLMIGQKIYDAMSTGVLAGFDSLQMEGHLSALANFQGGCERIKDTPIPRQYDYFTRLFVYTFSLILPFGLLGLAVNGTLPLWTIIPLSSLLSLVFIVMERTGAVNEHPFENTITDVPMSYLCNEIERDLREFLGEEVFIQKLKPENGYLF